SDRDWSSDVCSSDLKRRSWGPPGLRYLEHTSLNASLFMTAPESCGADFSGPCGVAQSARVGAGGLLVHGGLPENGNLRLGATNEIGRASCRERVLRA